MHHVATALFHSSKWCYGGTSRGAKSHCWFEASATAESEAGSVWEESLECTGGCRSDKELCGEAPQSLLYHHLTSMQKKVAHKPEGWGGGSRLRSKEDEILDRNPCKHMKRRKCCRKHHNIILFSFPFPPQAAESVFIISLLGKESDAVWQPEYKGFQPATDMYTNTAAVVPSHDTVSWVHGLPECSVSVPLCVCEQEVEGLIKLSWQVYSK